MKKLLANLITGAIVFLAWEAVTRFGLIDSILLPPASVVIAKLGQEITSGILATRWGNFTSYARRLHTGILDWCSLGNVYGFQSYSGFIAHFLY